MICAVCKLPIPATNQAGNNGAGSYSVKPGWCYSPHLDDELAEHMRAELARRGYPDPWRQK